MRNFIGLIRDHRSRIGRIKAVGRGQDIGRKSKNKDIKE